MELSRIDKKLVETVLARLEARGMKISSNDVVRVVELVGEEILYHFTDHLISQIEAILEIDPFLSEKEILQAVASHVADYFGAKAVTIRIYDPERGEMLSFGDYPSMGEDREKAIPFEDTIAGEVVKTTRTYLVPNLLKEEKYKDKEKVEKLGIHSMMAVSVSIPRFSLKDVDTQGVMQIYFEMKDKTFTPLEIKTAEVFSRRVSYVIARKRIAGLEKLNVTKDRIVEKIFLKLGKREGVKMKEVFDLIIPELLDTVRIQRCTLFSVLEDRQHVVLEAGYPEVQHGIGAVFSVDIPYIRAVVEQTGPFGEFEHEKVYPTYILITTPQESGLLPPDLKRFLKTQQINSVLYVPLKVNEAVNYFMAFDAQAQVKRFSDDEIEVFTFFGKELMKGLRLEKMDDILHDFKNPAIAVAGFSKRLQKLLEGGMVTANKRKVDQALEVILKETSRIQELALTLYGTGKEELVDLTEKLKERFVLNDQAIKELKLGNIRQKEGELQSPLQIRCFPLHIERVLDNLLNNASRAVPEEGGELVIRSYQRESWAVAEIANSGQMPEGDIDRFLRGESKGRGLHITTRLIKRMGGKMEVESRQGTTTFRVILPLVKEEGSPRE